LISDTAPSLSKNQEAWLSIYDKMASNQELLSQVSQQIQFAAKLSGIDLAAEVNMISKKRGGK